jgi:tRNA dimethylallyltransferase
MQTEVVSLDSRQVYRGMDIGTAKPSPTERDALPHHVLDVVDPDEPFDASKYFVLASRALDQIVGRGRVPMVVGGTGLYMRALLDGFFRGPGRHDDVRRRLLALARQRGPEYLHGRLSAVDPASARRIHRNDVVRLVRALEVFEVTGRPMSELWERSPGRAYSCRPLVVALDRPTSSLDMRIRERTRAMLQHGFVEEVARLLDGGYGTDLPSMSAVGYREVAEFLGGGLGREELEESIARATCRYARRQLRWFRADPRVRWVDAENHRASAELVTRFWELHAGESTVGSEARGP